MTSAVLLTLLSVCAPIILGACTPIYAHMLTPSRRA